MCPARPTSAVGAKPTTGYSPPMGQGSWFTASAKLRCARAAAQIVWLAGTLVTPGVVAAEPRDRDCVVFVLHDPSPAAGVLQAFDSMQGQLGELDLRIFTVHVPRLAAVSAEAWRAARIADQQRATALFWFERRAESPLRIYALHVPSGRVFARDVALALEATVQREQLAIILRAAIQAVLEGGDDLGKPLLVVPPVPIARQTPPSRPSPPSPPVPEAAATGGNDELRLRVALGYAGWAIAPDAAWQSGISGELMLADVGWLRAGLGAGYAAPTAIEGNGADAILTRIPVVARLGVAHCVGRVASGLEGGLLLERWHRRTIVRADALGPTEPTTRWRLGAGLLGRFELRVGERVGLYVMAGGDWLAAPHEFTIRFDQKEQKLATYAVQPHVGLGATFDLQPSTRVGDDEKNSTPPEATGYR